MAATRFEPTALHDLTPAAAAGIRMIATDIDGTITIDGALGPALLEALARVQAAGIEVILVSGRPAGEVLGLCRYLPGISRAVAENGLVGVDPQRGAWPLVAQTVPSRDEMRRDVQRLSAEVDIELHEANDVFARRIDLAFERSNHSESRLAHLADCATTYGLCCIWSSVHVHFSRTPPDKGRGLLALIGANTGAQVATIGDAVNDYGLFRRSTFALSVGTADLAAKLEHLPEECVPTYLSRHREFAAFRELVDFVLSAQLGGV